MRILDLHVPTWDASTVHFVEDEIRTRRYLQTYGDTTDPWPFRWKFMPRLQYLAVLGPRATRHDGAPGAAPPPLPAAPIPARS